MASSSPTAVISSQETNVIVNTGNLAHYYCRVTAALPVPALLALVLSLSRFRPLRGTIMLVAQMHRSPDRH